MDGDGELASGGFRSGNMGLYDVYNEISQHFGCFRSAYLKLCYPVFHT